MGGRILLVGTDMESAARIQEILMDADFYVCSRRDPVAGIETLKKAAPDLIVADGEMPDDGSVSFCRQVRAIQGLEDIPVLLCAGVRGREMVEERLGPAMGPHVHLIDKPVEKVPLLEIVGRLIGSGTPAPPPPEGPPAAQPSMTAAKPGRSGKSIVIIDDEPAFAILIQETLAREGYAMSVAFDVVEGGGLLRQHRPDLLILDVNMPGGGGRVVFQQVRQDKVLCQLPILVCTANHDLDIIKKSLGWTTEPNTYLLKKPVDPKRLILTVRRLIGPGSA